MNAAAVLNHLWQTTVFGLAAAGLALLLRRHAARVSFGVWLAASLKFLVPWSGLVALGARLPWPQTPAPVTAPVTLVALSYATVMMPLRAPVAPEAAAGVPWVWILGGIWLAGSVALAVRWYGQWRCTTRLVRAAAPVDAPGLEVRRTTAAVEPGIFGVVRPVLLIPAGLEQRLTAAQWAAVLAHEQCHVRRRDNLWAAVHRVVEVVFWFHPLVWWIGVRLVAARERACDEAVLRTGGDARAYAGGLVQVCRDYLDTPRGLACGVADGPLQARVQRILTGGWGRDLSRGGRWVLASLAAMTLLGPLAAGLVQTPSPLPVVSIRVSPPRTRPQIEADSASIHFRSQSLRQMILYAYGIPGYELGGMGKALRRRDWTLIQRFDLEAGRRAPATAAGWRAMLQGVLHRRFGLKLRATTRRTPVFALVVIPGVTFTPVAENSPGRVQTVAEFIAELNAPRLIGTPPPELVPLPRIVVDGTQLRGSYIFRMRSEPEDWSDERSILKAEGFAFKAETIPVTTYVIASAHVPAPK